MFIQVNATGGIAVYDQIARQVKFAVADGVLAPGDLIPSVRELAKELTVNPNTVARAYRQLQRDEVVESVPGTGLAVLTGARKACRTERKSLVRDRIRATLQETIDAGLPLDDVRSLVDAELDRLRKMRDGNKPQVASGEQL